MQAGKLNGRGSEELESAVQSLRHMAPEAQRLIVSLIGQLAHAEGVPSHVEYKPPIDNIDAWLTKLRSERKSERTIRLYGYLARRFLDQLPQPSRADVKNSGILPPAHAATMAIQVRSRLWI